MKVLDAAMEKVGGEVRAKGGVADTGSVFVVNHNADIALATLRYKFKDASFEAAEEPFDAAGKKFNRGSFIIKNVAAADMQKAAGDLGLQVVAMAAAPSVKTHPLRAPRVALLHTWLTTQTEGWWRQAFDDAQVPYTYISTQQIAKDDDLNAKFDVIIFPPVGRGTEAIVNGMPMWGNPLPWKKTPETPNLGSEDQTDDMRPGLGWTGVAHLQDFVRKGGVFLTVMDTADLAVSTGFTPGLSVARASACASSAASCDRRRSTRPARSRTATPTTSRSGATTARSSTSRTCSARRGGRRLGPDDGGNRPTGRGTADDADTPQGRRGVEVAGGTAGRPVAGGADHRRAAAQRHQRDSAGDAAARGAALRRHARAAGVGAGGERRRDRAARGGRRRPRSRKGTSSRFRTTRSGAARPRAATSWSSTRC